MMLNVDEYNEKQYSLLMKVQRAVAMLQKNQPEGSYHGCFSGGKDSIVIKELARLAKVRVKWVYNVTTIDPPELVHFIKRQHPDVEWSFSPRGNFFKVMKVKGLPTRRVRWCCEVFKEHAVERSTRILGIRVAESNARNQRYTNCVMGGIKQTTNVYPIRLWSDEDVWDFIKGSGIPYCELYDEGFARLGCIGCPQSGKQRFAQFKRWPRYEKLWQNAVKYTFEHRESCSSRFDKWEELWDWWLSDKKWPQKRIGPAE